MGPPRTFILLVLLFNYFCGSVDAQLVGSWNVTISPTNNGAQTAVSFYATGDWLAGFKAIDGNSSLFGPGRPVPADYAGSTMFVSGPFFGAPQAWNLTNSIGVILAEPVGYITNRTSSNSAPLNIVAIDYSQELDSSILFIGGSSRVLAFSNDTLAYVFASTPTKVVIDQNFSAFVPGSYSYATNTSSPQYMEIVPEPSTYALLTMSAAGALLWARRRRGKLAGRVS
jgi:hypothetical protein